MSNKSVSVIGALVIATLGVSAMGCGGGGRNITMLRVAASTDFNCPKHQVVILTSSGKTRDVDACGQRATYHFEDGDWRRIRTEGGGGGAAPAVAPGQPAQPMNHPGGTPSQPPPGKQL